MSSDSLRESQPPWYTPGITRLQPSNLDVSCQACGDPTGNACDHGDAWEEICEPMIGHEANVDPELYRRAGEIVPWHTLADWIQRGIRLVRTDQVSRPQGPMCCECGVRGELIGGTPSYNCECLPW